MESPFLSVVLNSARPGFTMHGRKDVHHFNQTLQSLAAQTYRNFELIISDTIYDIRGFDWSKVGYPGYSVFHVPVTHSLSKNMGYSSISATKNNGIMFSSGKMLFFLDDCSELPSNLLDIIVREYQTKKVFTNAMFIKKIGNELNGRDCRWDILERAGVDSLTNKTDVYGYMSFSMDAALKIGAFDEILDHGRQLDDVDIGKRLVLAGYKIAINKQAFVYEQEHSNESFCGEKGITFKTDIKCNGPIVYLKYERRRGEDRIKANHRGFTGEEIGLLRPCYKLAGETCVASGRGCCMIQNKAAYMQHPDCDIYIANPPIFNLANQRQIRLSQKNNYRVK